MKFNVLEFKADFKNRRFYALNIIEEYRFIFISNFTHAAALLFELLLSLHLAVCTFIVACKWRPIIIPRSLKGNLYLDWRYAEFIQLRQSQGR